MLTPSHKMIIRVWVFVMSCCISSAICCLIVTACTSGIALGYNYSLAEYIDLKETNVSVFIKRGVFDDEIAEEGEQQRRSGNEPDTAGISADKNLGTGSPDNSDLPAKSARRLDDSIFESNNQNKFESSLVRLTAKAPYLPSTTTTASRDMAKMENLISNFPPGSLDQMKAMQSVINARRAGILADVRRNQDSQTINQDDNKVKYLDSILSGRKVQYDQNDMVMPSNAFRDAVPRMDLTGWPKNAVPKFTQNMNFFGSNDNDYEFGHPPTFPPRPPTPIPSPIRPPSSSAPNIPKRTEERVGQLTRTPPRETPKAAKAFKEDLDKYKQRLLFNQYDEPNLQPDDFPRRRPDEDDYDEEFKGAPVRKKRNRKDVLLNEGSFKTIANPTKNPNTTNFKELNEKVGYATDIDDALNFRSLFNNNTIVNSKHHKDSSVETTWELTTESMKPNNRSNYTQIKKKHKNFKQNSKEELKKEKITRNRNDTDKIR